MANEQENLVQPVPQSGFNWATSHIDDPVIFDETETNESKEN